MGASRSLRLTKANIVQTDNEPAISFSRIYSSLITDLKGTCAVVFGAGGVSWFGRKTQQKISTKCRSGDGSFVLLIES
jgi:hypothetical protein